jgi:hypothetical protein
MCSLLVRQPTLEVYYPSSARVCADARVQQLAGLLGAPLVRIHKSLIDHQNRLRLRCSGNVAVDVERL